MGWALGSSWDHSRVGTDSEAQARDCEGEYSKSGEPKTHS